MEFLVVLIVLLSVVSLVWRFSRGVSIMEEWAGRHGYTILDRQRRYLRRGPFFWWTSRGQVVFRVAIRDRDGRLRQGWVRVGGFFLGLFSDQVEVRWDD